MQALKIGNFTLSENSDPFTVAEAGINHNGELEKAYQMIDAAKKVGASAVKFQTFTAKEFVTDRSQLFTYLSQGKEVTEPMLDMFERYEFTPSEWKCIKKKCDQEGIMFLSTPQNYSDLELLLEIGVDAIKVGSDDFTNIPLLKSYAKTGLPLIISSGMADIAEVHEALQAIGALDGYPTILLLCTSQYPTPPKDVNLNKLKTLKAAFPGILLGFSDHTQGSLAASLAVVYGAVFFEKHFTLDHHLPGPDHWFSEEPQDLMAWIQHIHLAKTMLGCALVRPTLAELEMRTIARRSVVAVQDIAQGELFTTNNLGLKRPGTGLAPALIEKVLGLTAKQAIKKHTVLQLGDF